jgi:hypothetical protein
VPDGVPDLTDSTAGTRHEWSPEVPDELPAWTRARGPFAIYAERGVIDILAWHPGRRALLVIELKTDLADMNELLGTLDRKRRLAVQVAAGRGWDPVTISAWLIISESRTSRRRVAAHEAMLKSALPDDRRTIRRWVRDPIGQVQPLRSDRWRRRGWDRPRSRLSWWWRRRRCGKRGLGTTHLRASRAPMSRAAGGWRQRVLAVTDSRTMGGRRPGEAGSASTMGGRPSEAGGAGLRQAADDDVTGRAT